MPLLLMFNRGFPADVSTCLCRAVRHCEAAGALVFLLMRRPAVCHGLRNDSLRAAELQASIWWCAVNSLTSACQCCHATRMRGPMRSSSCVVVE